MCLSLSSRFSLRSSLLSPGGRPFSTPSRPSGTAPSRHSGIESLHPSISLLILAVLVSSLFSRLSSLFSLLLMLLLLAAADPAAAAFFAFSVYHCESRSVALGRSPHAQERTDSGSLLGLPQSFRQKPSARSMRSAWTSMIAFNKALFVRSPCFTSSAAAIRRRAAVHWS